jgi:hypothetical protein
MVLRKWESRSLPFFRTLWTIESGASFFFIYIQKYCGFYFGVLKNGSDLLPPLEAVPNNSFFITRVKSVRFEKVGRLF